MTAFLINHFLRRRPEVFDHWYVFVPDFACSTQDFYRAVETELKYRGVPNLEMSRVEHSEGSILTGRREYLRLRRERLLFEVCAAPFGTSWFFSCRFAQFRLGLRLWHLILLAVAFFYIWVGFEMLLGTIGTAFFVAFFLSLIYIAKVAGAEKGIDVDSKLMRIPVIGPVYEVFFRRNTYYREDTRIMYVELVDAVVRSKVKEFAGEQQFGKGPGDGPEFKQDFNLIDMSLKGMFRGMWKMWG